MLEDFVNLCLVLCLTDVPQVQNGDPSRSSRRNYLQWTAVNQNIVGAQNFMTLCQRR